MVVPDVLVLAAAGDILDHGDTFFGSTATAPAPAVGVGAAGVLVFCSRTTGAAIFCSTRTGFCSTMGAEVGAGDGVGDGVGAGVVRKRRREGGTKELELARALFSCPCRSRSPM